MATANRAEVAAELEAAGIVPDRSVVVGLTDSSWATWPGGLPVSPASPFPNPYALLIEAWSR